MRAIHNRPLPTLRMRHISGLSQRSRLNISLAPRTGLSQNISHKASFHLSSNLPSLGSSRPQTRMPSTHKAALNVIRRQTTMTNLTLSAQSKRSRSMHSMRVSHHLESHSQSFGHSGAFWALAALAAGACYATKEAYAEEKQSAFSGKDFQKYKLVQTIPINYNTKVFRFEFPNKDDSMGMTVASFLLTRAGIGKEGEAVVRPYTPISQNSDLGHFDLLVKKYDEGVMSKHIHSLNPGDSLEVKGPIRKIEYSANQWKNLVLVAGGSGLTPMLQIMYEVAQNPNDKTEVDLIFANNTQEDILLRSQLDRLAQKANIRVHYVLDRPPINWKGSTGFVTKELLQKVLPKNNKPEETMVMVCGPPPMINSISGPKGPNFTQGPVGGILKDLGFQEKSVYKF